MGDFQIRSEFLLLVFRLENKKIVFPIIRKNYIPVGIKFFKYFT